MKITDYIVYDIHGKSLPVFDNSMYKEPKIDDTNIRLLLEFLLEKNGYDKDLINMNIDQLKIFINRELSIDKIVDK